jgi:hypothetical protein
VAPHTVMREVCKKGMASRGALLFKATRDPSHQPMVWTQTAPDSAGLRTGGSCALSISGTACCGSEQGAPMRL